MKFTELLDELKSQYKQNTLIRKNGTLLLAPGKIPNCRHMLFAPLSRQIIETHLVNNYTNIFPEEYIELLEHTNGANLYGVKLNSGKFSFAQDLLTIYGLPMTPPFMRAQDMEEPFDLRIEDLSRPNDTPKTWLKCGRYIKDCDFSKPLYIFINTENHHILSTSKKENAVVEKWNSLDECLCDLFSRMETCPLEYDYD